MPETGRTSFPIISSEVRTAAGDSPEWPSLVKARVGLIPVGSIQLRGLSVLENETMGYCAAVVDPTTVETVPCCDALGLDRSSTNDQFFLPHEALTAFALHCASLHPMARANRSYHRKPCFCRTSNVLLHVRQDFREHSLEQGADGGRSGKPLMGVNCALRKCEVRSYRKYGERMRSGSDLVCPLHSTLLSAYIW